MQNVVVLIEYIAVSPTQERRRRRSREGMLSMLPITTNTITTVTYHYCYFDRNLARVCTAESYDYCTR